MIIRKLWKHFAALAFFAALSSAAWCAEMISLGAWKGTVGKAHVMVCFSEFGESQYYDLRHRQGIRLYPSGSSSQDGHGAAAPMKFWPFARVELDELAPDGDGEGVINGHWTLQAKSPTVITGTWTAPRDGETRPIFLRKTPTVRPASSSNGGWGCEQAYYEPILSAMHLTFQPATFGKSRYREVSSVDATALEVGADWPHAQALNRYAMDWLRNQMMLSYDCNAGRNFSGAEPIGSSLKPILWTDHYLVLQDLMPEIYCGGAHGASSLSYLTWSWSQGRLVDTWDWLQGGAKSLVSHATVRGQPIKSGLFRLIARLHPRNEAGDDCREVLDTMSIHAPYPTAQGLVFNTSFFHAMRACNDAVKLEWKQLMPYLSVQGRALAEQFRDLDH